MARESGPKASPAKAPKKAPAKKAPAKKATTSRAEAQAAAAGTPVAPAAGWTYCDVKPQSVPDLRPDLNPRRASLIAIGRSKWVNGTVLKYYLYGAGTAARGRSRRSTRGLEGPAAQLQAVRDAFAQWKGLGIGLEFREVDRTSEAEVRIGFDQNDGSWSYVGRDLLGIPQDEPTMNFGWDLTTDWGRVTALHEIGHTLGFPHEHQNPNAGIEWDEPKVLAEFSAPPNSWTEQQIRRNILDKLDPNEVEGSDWDPTSVMEYPFEPGLINRPEKYRSEGVAPPTGLSPRDVQWVTTWYPGLAPKEPPTLEPFVSRPLSLKAGEQADFVLAPDATRTYSVGTFGASDVVLVLFEQIDGEPVYLAGDDDSGEDRNALVEVKLQAGRRYVVRLRLYSAWASGQTAVMVW
jgi:hypothetical protein